MNAVSCSVLTVFFRLTFSDEYVREYAKDMFCAWDLPSECPWLWDIIIEITATIKGKHTEDYLDGLTPILSQSEPWGGAMHQEHALACAASLCRDDYGMETIRAEEGRETYRGRIGSRCSRNAAFVSELRRAGLADADNLVIKVRKDSLLALLSLLRLDDEDWMRI